MTTIFYIIFSGNKDIILSFPQQLYSGMENYSLLAIPLFMLAGELMNFGGLTKRLISFSQTMVGHFRGGLAYVNVLTNMMLASIIGSASAQIAMMSKIMVPEMEERGYSREFSVATTSAAGLLGPIIPPSMLFIIYGIGSGVSIGAMFLAGIIPGVLLTISFIILIAFIGVKQRWPKNEKSSIKKKFHKFIKVLPALSVPIIIILGVISGAFTPTESAAIACVIALFVGMFLYKEIKLADFPKIFINTSKTTAVIGLLIAMANNFGWMLTFEQLPQQIATWMVSITESKVLFLLIVNIFLIIVGMFMDGIAALVILIPIFNPILLNYGIDPIHFGVIMCINLAAGLLTPPVGAGLFIATSFSGISMGNMIKAILPFLMIVYTVLLILTYVSDLVMLIPSLFIEN